MRIISFFGYFIVGLVGIMLISCIPSLYFGGLENYFHTFLSLTDQVIHPSTWVYETRFGKSYALTDFLGSALTYSMTILFGALIVGFIGGLIFAVVSFLLPEKVIKPFKRISYVVESIPDVMLAFGIQLFVVFVYKQFGFLLFQFSAVGDDEIYVLPILIIAILPFVAFYRLVLSMLEEEQQKDYVIMAKSKGLSKSYIIFLHVLPNILPTAFLHTKVITWATLSTLPAIEYIMNLYGVTSVLKEMMEFPDYIIIFFIIAAFFIPFYIIYGIAGRVINVKQEAQEAPVWKTAPFFGSKKRSYLAQDKGRKYPVYKNWKFMTGSLLIMLLFIISCLFTVLADPAIEVSQYQYDENGTLSDKAPFPPSDEHRFGTDRMGRHLDDVLLTGAKYTIGFALLLAALRIVGGLLLAIPYVLMLPARLRGWLDQLADGLHYVPQSMLAFFLLTPIIGTSSQLSVPEIIFWQLVILFLLVLPLMTMLMGKEISQALTNAYVTSGVVLGGSKLHLIRKHVWPQLRIRCFIMFGQQTLQVLILFIHLGVFTLYFGGTIIDGPYLNPALTEWSSQIPFLRYMLMSQQGYYSAVVIAAFLFLIFCVQLIVAGLKEVEHSRLGIKETKDRRVQTAVSDKQAAAGLTPSPDAFRFCDKTIELK